LKKSISILLFFIVCVSYSFAQYTVTTIPDPKKQGQQYFVSNPDHILSAGTEDEINHICQHIETANMAEVAVVVVNDYKGNQEIFDFSMQLFRRWGIGKKGKNNGLLLLVAKDRHKYQFITGYGLEGDLTDYQLNAIGKDKLVPYFRSGDYDKGVLDAMQEVSNTLLHEEAAADVSVEPDINTAQGWMSVPSDEKDISTEAPDQNYAAYETSQRRHSNTIYIVAALLFLLYILSDIRMQKKIHEDRSLTICSIRSIALYIFSGIFIVGFPIAFLSLPSIGNGIAILIPIIIQGAIFGYIRFTRGVKQKAAEFQDVVNQATNVSHWAKSNWFSILTTPSLWPALAKVRAFKMLAKKSNIPPDDSGNYTRLNWDEDRSQINTILSKGQRKENELSSNIYQVWASQNSGEKKVLQYKGLHHRTYCECESCHARTMPTRSSIKTIIKATYSHSGKGEKIRQCKNCNYIISDGFVVLPQLRQSSGSSSSSSSFSSSSSTSGSWGGGSSGGGGAGGSW